MGARTLAPLRELSRQVRGGQTTPSELVESCLERIEERDEVTEAWVCLDTDRARREASRLTDELKTGPPCGDLHGIPFGVKDIFDTAGLATEWGSPLYRGRVPAKDAALVARLREAGAIVLGKTHTTAFAFFDPGPTRNPHNSNHTPGGSSSGSAAAVAERMIPFALGSQTQGSVIRPASFCGVVGFKPSFGQLPTEGVMPFAPTLDQMGLFTPTVDDMAFLWQATRGASEVKEAIDRLAAPPWPIDADLEPEMERAFEQALERLRMAGFAVAPVSLPESFHELPRAAKCVMRFEAAEAHRQPFEQHGAEIGAKLFELIAEGRETRRSEYESSLEVLVKARADFAALTREFPVWVTPAALGPAPKGLASTGDPCCNLPFTALGVPALSFPFGRSQSGLPLGMQLAAGTNQEDLLLSTALRCESKLT